MRTCPRSMRFSTRRGAPTCGSRVSRIARRSRMPSLAEIQASVLPALLHRDVDGRAAALVRHRGPIAPARRLQVYRNNVHASLAAALADVYPVIARVVGNECLAALARHSVIAHPSRAGSLHAFGDALPSFLHDVDELAALPWLADLAALEWAVHEVYHEADDEPLDPRTLASL